MAKEIIDVRSNAFYSQKEENRENFELSPILELVIIHTDGKNYKLTAKTLESNVKIAETRLMLSPSMFDRLMAQLEMHKNKMEAVKRNAINLSGLADFLMKDKA